MIEWLIGPDGYRIGVKITYPFFVNDLSDLIAFRKYSDSKFDQREDVAEPKI